MRDALLTIETGHFIGNIFEPSVGRTRLEFEIATGMTTSFRNKLRFTDYLLPTTDTSVFTLRFNKSVAKRIFVFAKQTYVDGRGDFDCRAFLGYAMGWDAEISTATQRIYQGPYVGPDETQNGKPYLIVQKDGGVTPHALLGIDQPSKSLSVVGYESPLIIANNGDLLKAFGGIALMEIQATTEF